MMEALVMELVVDVMAPCRHPSVSWLPLEPPTMPPPRLWLLLLRFQPRPRPQLQQSSSQNWPAAPAAAVQPLWLAERITTRNSPLESSANSSGLGAPTGSVRLSLLTATSSS